MIGFYDQPPPAGQDAVLGFRLEADTFSGWDSTVQRQVVRGLVKVSSVKDHIHDIVEHLIPIDILTGH